MRFLKSLVIIVIYGTCLVIAFSVLTTAVHAQSQPVTMIGHVEGMLTLAADETDGNTLISLDPSVGGGDLLQIRSTIPGVVVSVELPTGQVITQANASSYSFVWETFDSAQVDPASSGSIAGAAAGRHEIVRFPAGQPAGDFRIVVNRGTAVGPVGVLARFQPLTGIRFGVSARGEFHAPNQPVTIAAFLMASEAALPNATISGKVSILVEQPGGVALTNWQLQQKTDVGNGRSHYVYTAALQNTASAFQQFRAEARQPDETVTLDHTEMWFRDVA